MAPPRLIDSDRWARDWERCRRCGRDHRSVPPVRHHGDGLCASCHQAPYTAAWRERERRKKKKHPQKRGLDGGKRNG